MDRRALAAALARFTNIQLAAELARRLRAGSEAGPEARSNPRPPHHKRYCDDCRLFLCAEERCGLGHVGLIFRVPDDGGEANRGDFGWFKRRCPDFKRASGRTDDEFERGES